MSNLQPEPIVDKNGVYTTRNKRIDNSAPTKRISGISAPPSVTNYPDDPNKTSADLTARLNNGMDALGAKLASVALAENANETKRIAEKLSGLAEGAKIWNATTHEFSYLHEARDSFIEQVTEEINNPEHPAATKEGYRLALGYVDTLNVITSK